VLYTVWFGAYPNHTHIKIIVKKQLEEKKKRRATAQIGTNVMAPVFHFSLHPEGPATGQFDQSFPWFSLVPEQILSWYPNSILHCMLRMQPYTNVTLTLGWTTLFMGDMGEGALHEQERKYSSNKEN
jgi:hypothetical protein